MDAKTTLFLTPKGLQELGNKRSELDFKSRSILTSLKNSEKTLSVLLEKIFIENKEATALAERLYRDEFITADGALSAKAQAASAKGVLPGAPKPTLATVARLNENSPTAGLRPFDVQPTVNVEADEAVKRQNDLVARVRREKAAADREQQLADEESQRIAKVEAKRIAAEADARRAVEEAARAAEEARAVADRLHAREAELAASEQARVAAEAELTKARAREEERIENARIESERVKAQLAAQIELERKRAEELRLEVALREDLLREAAKQEADREAARKEAEQIEIQRVNAAAAETARREAERKQAEDLRARAAEKLQIEAEERRLAAVRAAADIETAILREQDEALKKLDGEKSRLASEQLLGKKADSERLAEQLSHAEAERLARQHETEAYEADLKLRSEQETHGARDDSSLHDAHDKMKSVAAPRELSLVEENDTPAFVSPESIIPALTDTDSIDILPAEDEVGQNPPTVGKSLRPSLSRFLPGMRRAKTLDDNDAKKPVAVTSPSDAKPLNSPESVTAQGSIKPKIELTPVLSKVRSENAARHIPSLIRPAIDPTKKDATPTSLLGNPAGAGGDFLSSFGRETVTTVPQTKSSPLKFGRGKPELDLKPVSLSHTKALALLPKVVVSEGVFLLSDFCIDNMSSIASDFIDKLERCRDRQSLQDVVKDIYGQFSINEKLKIAALLKTIEDINATA